MEVKTIFVLLFGLLASPGCAPRPLRPRLEAPARAPSPDWRAENRHVERCGREIRYPRDALKDNVAGDVIFRIELNERGVPVSASVIESPDPRLTAAVIADLGRCRFEVLRDNHGKPIARVIPFYKFHFTP